MERAHALGILIATPVTVAAFDAHATEPVEPYRSMDPGQEASFEDALASEHGDGDGSAWLSLGAFFKKHATGRSDAGLMMVLNVPLERTARLRSGRSGQIADPPPSQATPQIELPALQISARVARACVQAAWRTHGWSSEGDLDRMGSRSRWSAVLPEVRVRAARGWDESFRLAPTDSDPYRSQQVTGTSRWLEGRLIWRLDRVVFSDHEIPIERLRMQRAEARSRLAGKVVGALFDWQKAQLAATDPTLSAQEHLNALVQRTEAEAVLDVLTGGWFSDWLRASAAPPQEPRKPAPRQEDP
jgi:hypothetical protein